MLPQNKIVGHLLSDVSAQPEAVHRHAIDKAIQIDIAIYSRQTPYIGILPDERPFISPYRRFAAIVGNPEFTTGSNGMEVVVVDMGIDVEQRLLAIMRLHQLDDTHHILRKFFAADILLDVNTRDEVQFGILDVIAEIPELLVRR